MVRSVSEGTAGTDVSATRPGISKVFWQLLYAESR